MTQDDERYFVVNGRRWRATDPGIPERLREELVAELMAARRAVRDDPATARPRVQDAKVALGERGDPWWEPTPDGQRTRLAAAMRTLLRHRRPNATICPSDAARVAGGTSWRGLMAPAREVAAALAATGVVVVRQRGADVDISAVKGPVRIARGYAFDMVTPDPRRGDEPGDPNVTPHQPPPPDPDEEDEPDQVQ